MNLGEKLNQNRIAAKLEEERKQREREEKQNEKRRVLHEKVKKMLNHAAPYIEQRILAGEEPSYRVRGSEVERCINLFKLSEKCMENYRHKLKSDEVDIFSRAWDQFSDSLYGAGLRPVIKDEHDGMGVKSWYVIGVEPVYDINNEGNK